MRHSNYRALLWLGIPIVIGQIGVIILGFADTLMIGHHSTHELAAASFVNNMFNLAIIFSTGFSYGLTPIVGSLFGQNRCEEVGRTLKTVWQPIRCWPQSCVWSWRCFIGTSIN